MTLFLFTTLCQYLSRILKLALLREPCCKFSWNKFPFFSGAPGRLGGRRHKNGCGDRSYCVRHENLHNFEKNLDQNGSLWKKLEHFEICRPKKWDRKISIFFINIFIENSVETFRYKKNRNFSISNFFIFIQFPMKIVT